MSSVLTKRLLFGKGKTLKSTHLLSLVGIIIGVIALLIVSSVMNGLRDDMMNRIIGTKAEIHVYGENNQPIADYHRLAAAIAESRGVVGVSPVVKNELLIQKGEQIAVVEAFGIETSKHLTVTELDSQIQIGSLEEFAHNKDTIIIGLDLSFEIGATVGEYVRVSSPLNRRPTPFGMLPKTRELKVVGIFSSGMPQYDKGYTYIPLSTGQFFSGNIDQVDMLSVKITNPHRSQRVATSLSNKLNDNYMVEDWSSFDRSLFAAMRLEKTVMMTVLTLMILISGFNMACSSIRLVSEKQKEIGVLKAIGMKQSRISRSFLAANMVIGLTGAIIGMVISSVFIFVQDNYKLVEIPVPGFPVQWLPVSFSGRDFAIVSLIVLIITYSASLLPLRRINNMQPLDVIRKVL